MQRRFESGIWKQIAVVAISLAVSTILRVALRPVLHDKASLLPFTLAVIASSYYGGLVAGLVATFVGAIVADFFFVQPVGEVLSIFPGDFVLFTIFVIFGVSVSVLNHAVSRAIEALRKTKERIELAASVAHIGFHEWLIPDAEGEYQAWLARIHPEDRERIDTEMQKCIAHKVGELSYEYRIALPDGTLRYIEGRSRVLQPQPGDGRRIIGADIDITDRKHLEQALMRSNQELERFAHAVAHDLQEPLRGIRTFTERSLSVSREKLDDTSVRLLEFVIQSADRMSRLIRAILDFASAGSEVARQSRPVNTRAVVDMALGQLRQSIEENAARIQIGELPDVEGNEAELERLFQNLVGNALKYRGPAAPEIRITAERQGKTWLFSVQDNGIGIDPKYHATIFETFRRLHSQAEYEGTGLGLATCKRIVQQHGGRLWVQSQPGNGSTFFFTLPEADGASRKPPGRSEGSPGRSQARGV